MEIKEIREKSIKDLYKQLNKTKKELDTLVFSISVGKSNDLNTKRSLKKQIANLKTVIREKQELTKNEKA